MIGLRLGTNHPVASQAASAARRAVFEPSSKARRVRNIQTGEVTMGQKAVLLALEYPCGGRRGGRDEVGRRYEANEANKPSIIEGWWMRCPGSANFPSWPRTGRSTSILTMFGLFDLRARTMRRSFSMQTTRWAYLNHPPL